MPTGPATRSGSGRLRDTAASQRAGGCYVLEHRPKEQQRVPGVPCGASARGRGGEPDRRGTPGRRTMRRHQLLSLAGALALLGPLAWAGEVRAADTAAGTEVTGIVTQADKQARWIVVDGQTYRF